MITVVNSVRALVRNCQSGRVMSSSAKHTNPVSAALLHRLSLCFVQFSCLHACIWDD